MNGERNELFCTDCGARIRDKVPPKLGHQVTCRQCGTKLEVVSVEPLELDFAYDYDDWDDDDDDDDWDDDDDDSDWDEDAA